MNITVKSVKVLKTGKNDFGPFIFTKIFTDQDVEYTTYAEDASLLSPGSVIIIANMDENDKGQKSFKKYELVSGSTAPPSSAISQSGKEPNDNEYWERKQAIDRASFEGQTAVKHLTELTIAGIKLEDCPELLRNTLITKIQGYTSGEKITLIKD